MSAFFNPGAGVTLIGDGAPTRDITTERPVFLDTSHVLLVIDQTPTLSVLASPGSAATPSASACQYQQCPMRFSTARDQFPQLSHLLQTPTPTPTSTPLFPASGFSSTSTNYQAASRVNSPTPQSYSSATYSTSIAQPASLPPPLGSLPPPLMQPPPYSDCHMNSLSTSAEPAANATPIAMAVTARALGP